MNTTNHTPTPWIYALNGFCRNSANESQFTFGPDLDCVGVVFNRNGPEGNATDEANAAFIVRACNSHDELVKALECNNRSLFWFLSFLGEELSVEHRKQVFKIIEDARTAITHAKG